MKSYGCIVVGLIGLAVALVTFPVWAMGPAVFMDSERKIRSFHSSPDGNRYATVEEFTVGGVPNIVVIVRNHWLPNWYLTGCVAASHYQGANVLLEWTSNSSIALTSDVEQQYWDAGNAPFREGKCETVKTTIETAQK